MGHRPKIWRPAAENNRFERPTISRSLDSGQTLLIPTEDEPQPPTFEYTVQPGDTLWAISRRFGVTIEDILSLNDIPDPSRIFPGQVLIIPGAAPPRSQPPTWFSRGHSLVYQPKVWSFPLRSYRTQRPSRSQFDLPGTDPADSPKGHSRSHAATGPRRRRLSGNCQRIYHRPGARRTENGLIKSAMPSAICRSSAIHSNPMEP